MTKTRIKALKYLGNRDAMLFIQLVLNDYDLSQLSEIKFRHVPYTVIRPFPNCYGNAKPPNPFAKTKRARETYRISCSVRGRDEDMPYTKHVITRGLPRRYKFRKPAGLRYKSIEELMVFIMGHELFHYLAWTKQVPHNFNDEFRADEMGDEWVNQYRDWKRLYPVDDEIHAIERRIGGHKNRQTN